MLDIFKPTKRKVLKTFIILIIVFIIFLVLVYAMLNCSGIAFAESSCSDSVFKFFETSVIMPGTAVLLSIIRKHGWAPIPPFLVFCHFFKSMSQSK